MNFVFISLDKYPIKESYRKKLEVGSFAMTILLLIEVIIRLSYYKKKFFSSFLNIWDLIILFL